MPLDPASSSTFGAQLRRLRRHLGDGDVERATDVLDAFNLRVVEAVVARDRAQLAQLRGQAARLRRAVHAAGGEGGLASDLRRIERTLEVAWTAEAMARARQEPAVPEQFTLRGRLLRELRDGPRRPRDLAVALGADRTQVSRELRQLAREGRARASSGLSEDRRAVRWQLT